jgi:hypothetical protein
MLSSQSSMTPHRQRDVAGLDVVCACSSPVKTRAVTEQAAASVLI